MKDPETLEQIPWGEAPEPAIATSAPRRCKHPRERRIRALVGMQTIETCGRCGHEFVPEMQRRGRAVRKYGKAAELAAARRLGLEPRGTSRDPEDAGGAMDPAVLQSKTGPGFASVAWIHELEALAGVAKGRPRILLAAEKPGRGSRKGGDRNARRLVVMFEEELVRLTGLDARRRNLEALADAAARLVSAAEQATAYSRAFVRNDREAMDEIGPGEPSGIVPELRAILAELAKTPAR